MRTRPTRASASRSSRDAKKQARSKADRVHDRYVQRTYGLRPGEYAERLARQDGRCAVCRRRSKKRLAVEHSHITGTIRGLVCMRCNRDVLGALDGDPDRIQAAIDFLEAMKHDLETYLAAPTTLSSPLVEEE